MHKHTVFGNEDTYTKSHSNNTNKNQIYIWNSIFVFSFRMNLRILRTIEIKGVWFGRPVDSLDDCEYSMGPLLGFLIL